MCTESNASGKKKQNKKQKTKEQGNPQFYHTMFQPKNFTNSENHFFHTVFSSFLNTVNTVPAEHLQWQLVYFRVMHTKSAQFTKKIISIVKIYPYTQKQLIEHANHHNHKHIITIFVLIPPLTASFFLLKMPSAAMCEAVPPPIEHHNHNKNNNNNNTQQQHTTTTTTTNISSQFLY